MDVQEGLDILLEVARYLKNNGRDDIHFTCIGGGPGLGDLIRMKDEMGLDDTVNFTGRIPDRELIEILSTADVCVNPDKPSEMNDMSTMIKVMEYMALGKPIVQFDLKEGRYSAKEASLYAETNGFQNFAEKILELLDNEELRKKMGEFGRKRVAEKLAWQYSIPNLLNAYKRALAK
jgi:glycosyltransferase involved in cell wall biosynthesis